MFYRGLDVSTAKLQACLLEPAGGTGQPTAVDNTAAGIAFLLHGAARQGALPAQVHAVREATGGYHEPPALALFDSGGTVSLGNPAQTQDLARGLAVRPPTDGVESWVLARCGARLTPPAWHPPPPEVRDWRALLARREARAQDWRREQPRRDKARATATPRRGRQSLDDALRFLAQERARLQQESDDPINGHPRLQADSARLTRSPAGGPPVSNPLLTLLRRPPFQSAGQLAAYLGVVPVERHSGTALLSPARLSTAGPARGRAGLSMAAVVAIRENPPIKALYERLGARGKAKQAALGAALRTLVHLGFGVFKTRQPYQADYAGSP